MENERVLIIENGDVVTPFEVVRNGRVAVKGGRIGAVGPRREVQAPRGAVRISAGGGRILPGLIDTHIHGLCGVDCMEGVEALLRIRRNLVRYGVTGFLATVYCVLPLDLERRLQAVKIASRRPLRGARILGAHLEGPYFNPSHGSLAQWYAPVPSPKAQEKMIAKMRGVVRLVTLAPEVKRAAGLIKRLTANGIVVGIGHSDASEKQLGRAVEAGLSHVIHVFNALRQRASPLVGGEGAGLSDLVLTDDRLTAEVIADGVHVGPTLLELLVRAKGTDRVVLVTDSVMAGVKPGKYRMLDGAECLVTRRATYTLDGKLAGSILTLNRALANMTRFTSATFAQAVRMATWNPARIFGLHRRKGSIAPGKDADICIADEKMNVQMTLVKGRVVFER